MKATTFNNQSAQTYFDESIRLEKIIWIASQGDAMNEDLENFLEGEHEEIEGFINSEEFNEAIEDGETEQAKEIIIDARKFGFLVQAATPCPRNFDDEGGYSFSWGNYSTRWFYTEALDAEFLQRVVRWRTDYIEQAKARAAKKTSI